MTEQDFDKQVSLRLEKVLHTLSIKAKEYRRYNNPFHNFEVGSQITGQTPTSVLDGFLLKHLISYRDMLSDLKHNKHPTTEMIEEKFGDIINYFILQEMLFKKTIKK